MGMLTSRRKIGEVVAFLGSASYDASLHSLNSAGAREWQCILNWLDSSGLALYFLHRLKTYEQTNAVPEYVLSELEDRHTENSQRTLLMKRAFEVINRQFYEAGVTYAAVKGFTLVPEYCPDASLRPQADLDYFITPESLDEASAVLTGMGYTFKKQVDDEYAFWIPKPQSTERGQYSPDAPYMVELHLSLWDRSLNELAGTPWLLSPQACAIRRWGELAFNTLSERDIFFGQILHTFRHCKEGWLRAVWLYELAHFLSRHSADHALWNEVNRELSHDAALGEIVGIVTGMVGNVFGDPQLVIFQWNELIRPAARKWINVYGRDWVIDGRDCRVTVIPATKLFLFLNELYSPELRSRFRLLRRCLFPIQGVHHFAKPCGTSRLASWTNLRNRTRWVASRMLFHAGANLRYLWELPRWWRLTRRNYPSPPAVCLDEQTCGN